MKLPRTSGLAPQEIWKLAAKGGIQDLDRVDYGCLLTLSQERRLKLQNATGIASRDDAGSEMRNELGFAIPKGLGGARLNQVVDSRGAAADGGFGDLDELDPGNAREQRARLLAHALRMLQMAGIVKRHAQF